MMIEETIDALQSGDEEQLCTVLKAFNSKHVQMFSFPDISKERKKNLLELVLAKLDVKASSKTYAACLECIRIISREKDGLETITSQPSLKSFVKHAGLEKYAEQEGENVTIQEGDYSVMIEAQKCLCNLIFNSHTAQKSCSANGCVEGIVQRLKTYKDPDLSYDVKFYDMRMLFLITALVRDVRPILRHDLHGFTYLIEVLDLCLSDWEEGRKPVSDQNVDLSCEVLKILFNITQTCDRNNLDEEEEAHYMRLVSILHDLLICVTATKEKAEELRNHTVNLLTNMPRESYEELLTPLTEGASGGLDNKEVEYDGKNMEAITVLLDFLGHRLDVPKSSLKEALTPILLCMCEVCRGNRCIRKYCRVKILPYLRNEVRHLPEEGTALRNKLCKLFTHPATEVKDLAADFLFVLCKESVMRFVKYTGYGNAAGLLARRGLMGGGRGAEYSSESEDSETEEYCTLKEGVNPVTGRWETTKSDPMAGMTEEQKEHEAMELVKKIDQLSRGGIIQPMKVGIDGKPTAVESVLELTENLNINSIEGTESDSD